MKDETFINAAFIAIICFCGLIIGGLTYQTWQHHIRVNDFQAKLQTQGLTVQESEIKSPAVIILVNETEFLDKVSELHATTIYKMFNEFYVFTSDYVIAYCYTV